MHSGFGVVGGCPPAAAASNTPAVCLTRWGRRSSCAASRLIAYPASTHLGDQKARWTMNTSPTENHVFGIVTFTARGDAALERLADALVAGCDGSPDGIADILERVLKTPGRGLTRMPQRDDSAGRRSTWPRRPRDRSAGREPRRGRPSSARSQRDRRRPPRPHDRAGPAVRPPARPHRHRRLPAAPARPPPRPAPLGGRDGYRTRADNAAPRPSAGSTARTSWGRCRA